MIEWSFQETGLTSCCKSNPSHEGLGPDRWQCSRPAQSPSPPSWRVNLNTVVLAQAQGSTYHTTNDKTEGLCGDSQQVDRAMAINSKHLKLYKPWIMIYWKHLQNHPWSHPGLPNYLAGTFQGRSPSSASPSFFCSSSSCLSSKDWCTGPTNHSKY